MCVDVSMLHFLDVFNKSWLCEGIEWIIEVAQLEQDAAERPYVSSVIASIFCLVVAQNFGALVQKCTYVFHSCLPSMITTSYPKITNLNRVFLPSKKNITGFQISMNNILLVQIIHPQENFEQKPLYP